MVVDVLLVLGVAIVLPLATGGRWARWAVCAGAATLALGLPQGAAAAVLGLPWLVVAGHLSWVALSSAVLSGRHRGPTEVAAAAVRALAAAYAGVAGACFVASRAGAELFGIGEPIVELTAVHYTYAGCAALTLAAIALERSADEARGRRLALAAVVLTALAPPVVAVGFVAGAPLPQVGGAVLMTLGVWATASRHLVEAAFPSASATPTASRRMVEAAAPTATAGGTVRGARRTRVLLAVSGLSVWVPMVLAVAWAAGQHWDVPFLSIPDMARTHGVANALGFTMAGLAARHLQRAPSVPRVAGPLAVAATAMPTPSSSAGTA